LPKGTPRSGTPWSWDGRSSRERLKRGARELADLSKNPSLLPPFSGELDAAALLKDSGLNRMLFRNLRELLVTVRMDYGGSGSGFARCREWLATVWYWGSLQCTELEFCSSRHGGTTLEDASEAFNFNWQGQSLTRLSMSGAWMSWDSSSFGGLRSLVLRNTFHDATGLHAVLHFLARNSELEALSLHVAGRPFSLPPGYSDAAITLDRLVSLEIGGAHWNAQQLLGQLVLPRFRTFVLEATRSSACTSLLALNRSAMPHNDLERLHLR
jgi:hypothetical protein